MHPKAVSASTALPPLTALPSICREHRVRSLDLFGSALTSDFDPAHSDIDCLVIFEEMPEGGYAEAYFSLHAALEALFGRRVDLLTDRSVENPFLRRSIDASRRRLYGSA
nr:nucleotidyltransferase domain-containing protein [uncultured Rhodopila sp.]